jgi:hypothetical protein
VRLLTEYGPGTGCTGYGKRSSGYIKYGEFLDRLEDCALHGGPCSVHLVSKQSTFLLLPCHNGQHKLQLR